MSWGSDVQAAFAVLLDSFGVNSEFEGVLGKVIFNTPSEAVFDGSLISDMCSIEYLSSDFPFLKAGSDIWVDEKLYKVRKIAKSADGYTSTASVELLSQ